MINLMSVRVQNSPKRSPDQVSDRAMPHIAINCPTWWNSKEQQMQQCLSKNLGFKVDSSPQLCQESKHSGLQLPDQESSSNQSYGQSHHDVGATAGATSQDQCISIESGEGEKYGKDVGGQIKPMFLLSSPDNVFSLPQIDHNHAMIQAHHPNPYVDPHIGPLFTCGLQTMMIGNGIAPACAPLPLDLAEDGRIYVNAKQYHGILRRRQSRAKLEAQNKLIKSRKPYLHESRHLHAVKRVRGSGGRFLSTKKVQENKDESELNSPGSISGTVTSCSDITSVCVNNNNSFIFQQLDLLCSGSGAAASSSIA